MKMVVSVRRSHRKIAPEDWADMLASAPRIADRITAVGEALSFSPIWDGMDLLAEFTRLISIPGFSAAGAAAAGKAEPPRP